MLSPAVAAKKSKEDENKKGAKQLKRNNAQTMEHQDSTLPESKLQVRFPVTHVVRHPRNILQFSMRFPSTKRRVNGRKLL